MRIGRSGERRLTSRDKWPDYLGGMLTEVAFVLALTVLALLIAVVAKAVF